MGKPIALFDLDGTLADYPGRLFQDLLRLHSPGELLPPVMGEPLPPWLEARKALIVNQAGWFRYLPRYEPGFHLLEIAKSIGFECHILTKGPRHSRGAFSEKAYWCDEHVPGLPIHVVSNKELVYGRVLFDDWPPYVEAWLEARPRGIAVVPAHPWNENLKHERALRYKHQKDATHIHEALRAAYTRETSR